MSITANLGTSLSGGLSDGAANIDDGSQGNALPAKRDSSPITTVGTLSREIIRLSIFAFGSIGMREEIGFSAQLLSAPRCFRIFIRKSHRKRTQELLTS